MQDLRFSQIANARFQAGEFWKRALTVGLN
jgi:hypothetical protein